MEFTVETSQFAEALEQIRGAVDRKHTIPVLSHCLIEVVPHGVQLAGTDLELGVRLFCPATVVGGGGAAVPARRLLEIVKSLGEAEARVRTLENDWVQVTSGRSAFKLAALKEDAFPKFPAVVQALATIPSGVLRGLIGRTAFAARQEEGRYALNAALLVLKTDRVEMVATDGSRLSLASHETKQGRLQHEEHLLIPRRALGPLQRLAGTSTTDMLVAIAKDEGHLFFTLGDALLITRVIAGEFPKYEGVLPRSNGGHATLDTSQFRDALERVSLLASEHHHGVTVALAPGRITISSSGGDTGEATEIMDASYAGEPIRIGFNCLFLQDFFGVVRREQVEIALKDAQSAVEFRPNDQSESGLYRYIVMPMRQ